LSTSIRNSLHFSSALLIGAFLCCAPAFAAVATDKPDPSLITAPTEPTQQDTWWKFYAGTMAIAGNNFYDPHGVDFQWAYSRKEPLPENPRIVVHMHGSGGGIGSMQVFGPSPQGDIEVRAQDAEAHNVSWREWWTFGKDGTPYPGRRINATLDFLAERYGIDTHERGIVLQGPSMGGAGAVIQTMILPSPWRERIAYSSALAGVIMPRQIAQRDPVQYSTFPPDTLANEALWDSIDFAVQSKSDPIVRGIHYRHMFSSDDQFSAGVKHASTQLLFVNLVEQQKIGGAFAWVQAGHAYYEDGVNLPDMSRFEVEEQDVTLDRAHPAITHSTGNYPLSAKDRTNYVKYPRGHYNMGITWDHANIIDDESQIVFPLKYTRRVGLGKGIPDQPESITISVTPRRAQHFTLRDGETLKWSWDGGALTGQAKVNGDTVTINAIPLASGDNYKNLRLYR
jgi:peptidoglycan/xylan/chitin deacetylase (PgdA/CDA1 family)